MFWVKITLENLILTTSVDILWVPNDKFSKNNDYFSKNDGFLVENDVFLVKNDFFLSSFLTTTDVRDRHLVDANGPTSDTASLG